MEKNNMNNDKPNFSQSKFTPREDNKKPGFVRPAFNKRPMQPENTLPTYVVLRRFVCRTNAGGVIRRMNIITAVGDAKTHKIGIGSGKASTYQAASKQAETNANNSLRSVKILSLKNNTVKTVEQSTIFEGYGLKLIIKQVHKPNLICANKAIRAICQLVGINAINVKVIAKSGAIQNQIYAFIDAITSIESPRDVAKRLNKPISDILNRNIVYRSI
jgi:ribosomal protein S5